MNVRIQDSMSGLINQMTGTGTHRDKSTHAQWHFTRLEPRQLVNAYRAGWVSRKIVDIPAHDILREGWSWQADKAEIDALVREERRLGLKGKLMEATRLARLHGGAAIILGDGANDPTEPLIPRTVRRGGLRYITIASMHDLAAGDFDQDILSPTFNEPAWYDVVGSSRTSLTRLHPSRVVRFIGNEIPAGGITYSDAWGDSVLQPIMAEINAAASGVRAIARMLEESSVSYYKIRGLIENLATEEGTATVMKTLQLINQSKSMMNAVAIDAESEGHEQFSATFAGMPEIIHAIMQLVSGGADIPVTRLLGQSPSGMNATGESDMRNYYDRLASDQEITLLPRMDRIFDAMVPSALGRPRGDETIKFNPLWQMSEEQQVDLDAKTAELIATYEATGLVPSGALEAITRASMVKSPTFANAEEAWEQNEAGSGPVGNVPGDDDEAARANRLTAE